MVIVNHMQPTEQGDGVGTTPYHEAGELAGITRLVDAFYVNMDTLAEAEIIRKMHPQDLAESRKKLTYFLCGWLGGPKPITILDLSGVPSIVLERLIGSILKIVYESF